MLSSNLSSILSLLSANLSLEPVILFLIWSVRVMYIYTYILNYFRNSSALSYVSQVALSFLTVFCYITHQNLLMVHSAFWLSSEPVTYLAPPIARTACQPVPRSHSLIRADLAQVLPSSNLLTVLQPDWLYVLGVAGLYVLGVAGSLHQKSLRSKADPLTWFCSPHSCALNFMLKFSLLHRTLSIWATSLLSIKDLSMLGGKCKYNKNV